MYTFITTDIDDPKYTDIILNRYKSYLSVQEFERYFSFKNDINKKSFLIARGELKTKLSAFINKSPEEITFSYTKNGKPYVDGSAAHFSISHTNGLIAIVISNDNIAVDIERKKVRNFEKLSKFVFNKSIVDIDLFYKMWTAKEAIVKYHGDSIFSQKTYRNFVIDNGNVKIPGYDIFHTSYKDCFVSILNEAK